MTKTIMKTISIVTINSQGNLYLPGDLILRCTSAFPNSSLSKGFWSVALLFSRFVFSFIPLPNRLTPWGHGNSFRIPSYHRSRSEIDPMSKFLAPMHRIPISVAKILRYGRKTVGKVNACAIFFRTTERLPRNRGSS